MPKYNIYVKDGIFLILDTDYCTSQIASFVKLNKIYNFKMLKYLQALHININLQ